MVSWHRCITRALRRYPYTDKRCARVINLAMSDLVAGDGYGSVKKGQDIEDTVVFLELYPCVNMYEHFFLLFVVHFIPIEQYENRTVIQWNNIKQKMLCIYYLLIKRKKLLGQPDINHIFILHTLWNFAIYLNQQIASANSYFPYLEDILIYIIKNIFHSIYDFYLSYRNISFEFLPTFPLVANPSFTSYESTSRESFTR